jgi:hypothetical protein
MRHCELLYPEQEIGSKNEQCRTIRYAAKADEDGDGGGCRWGCGAVGGGNAGRGWG